MFSGFGSPSLKSVQRRLSKSISRAGELLTGVGPTPTKQFKNAIVDGDEDKAIDIYTANDGDKPLYQELHPSKPFPSKKEKSSTDTPLHLATRTGLMKLCVALLGKGGDPTVLNDRLETCLHCVCSLATHPDVRTTIMEILLQWRGVSENAVEGEEEKLSLNRVDVDGDTAIHLAALNGLVGCVEKLIALGAIISIVNKNNRTCCELADESSHSALALALELALVFQPVDSSMAEFAASQRFPYDGHQGRLLLSGQSFGEDGADLDAFIEEALGEVTGVITERDRRDVKDGKLSAADLQARIAAADYTARAEALLGAYAWDVAKLVKEYRENPVQVLTAARLQPFLPTNLGFNDKEEKMSSATSSPDTITSAAGVEKKSSGVADEVVAAVLKSEALPEEKHVERVVKEIEKEEEAGIDVDAADIDITFDEAGGGSKADPAQEEATVLVPPTQDTHDPVHPEVTTSTNTTSSTSAELTPGPVDLADVKTAALSPVPVVVDPKDAPPMEEEGCCFVCGEVMLPSAPIEQFLAGKVEDVGSHRLQCGSGHAFCVDCWAGSLTVQVKDNGLGCLPCLGYKCGEVLDKRWAEVLLSSADLRSQFLQRRQRLVVDCCSALKACPIESCGVVVRVAGLYEQTDAVKHGIPASALCSNGHLFCLECSQPAHSPCTCQQLPGWHKLVQDEIKSVDIKGKNGDENDVQGADLANALWVAANTKKCPRCQTPIEKDEGCNHMNCRKCRKEFCWICMQDWTLHSDNTGGYFQCNRFVANLKVGDLPEGSGVGELWAEESGNAHAETLRLREKNKRMARFIHHFTRYKAHSDSVKLEGRMFSETARRIHEGLLASMDGGSLKWLQGYQAPHPLMVADADTPASSPRNRAPSPLPDAAPLSLPVSGEKGAATVSESSAAAPVRTKKKHFTDATAFLKDGFEELLKCRCILQWSYPYAYFEFENDDYNDYSRSLQQQRRGRYLRDQRSAFDLLQSELEAIVETLSDVVARRRLRAGRDQISLVTRAARSKRIELESVIVTAAINQQVQRSRNSPTRNSPSGAAKSATSSSRSRPEGYHRTRQIAVPSSRSQRSRQAGGLFRSDSEESIDIAALIFEMDLANAGATTSAASAGGEANAALALQERTRQIQRLLQAFGADAAAMGERTSDTTDLPPPIPHTAATPAGSSRSSGRQSRSAPHTPPPGPGSAGSTPSTRRLELRQARNSPGGHRVSYTIDPDFEMDESESESDDEEEEEARGGSGEVAAAGEEGSIASGGAMQEPPADGTSDTVTAAAASRRKRASRTAAAAAEPAADSAERTAEYERAAALRELLRFGSAGGIHGGRFDPDAATGRSPSISASRQQMREARLIQRAEEEQQLNRAILMSLQENQTADRRPAAGGVVAAGEEGGAAVSSEPTEEDVAMLVSMGFTREQSVQALVENRMNVELAANRLLGIDF